MRPTDWSVVELSDDPVPGDVWGVKAVGRGYTTIASAARTATSVLKKVKESGGSSIWSGDAAEVFRDTLDDFPELVEKCADSFELAADAVSKWSTVLDNAQDKADRGLANAILAQQDLDAAQSALADAEAAASSASSDLTKQQNLYDLYKNQAPPAGITVPTSYQLSQLRSQRSGANSSVSSASGDVEDAQTRLDAAKALVAEALEDYEDGATQVKTMIDEAKDAGVPADSWWEAVFNSEAWQVLVAVLTVVAVVLAVAAIFITGPLALIIAAVSLVIGAILLLDDIMAFASGEMSPAEFAFAIATSVIPGGRAARGASRAATAVARGADDAVDAGTSNIRRVADTGDEIPVTRAPEVPTKPPVDAPKPRDPYSRPSGYRNGVRDEVWDSAKGPDGKVRDPKTQEVMDRNEPWDMGHKPGWEFSKHRDSAADRGITRKEFLNEHNEPSHYRPETPATNRGHSEEAPPEINHWQ